MASFICPVLCGRNIKCKDRRQADFVGLEMNVAFYTLSFFPSFFLRSLLLVPWTDGPSKVIWVEYHSCVVLGGRGGYQQTDFGGFPVYPAQSDSNSRQQGYDAYGYNDHSTYNSSYSSHSANGSGSAGYQNDNHRQQGRDRDRLTMPPPVYQSPPAGPPRYYTDNYRRSN